MSNNTDTPNTPNDEPDTQSQNQPPEPDPPHLTPTYRLFLEKLVTTRDGTGVTRFELARLLKVPESHIIEAESGLRPMSFLEVRAYCRALDIDLVEFTETLDALIRAVLETPPFPDRGE